MSSSDDRLMQGYLLGTLSSAEAELVDDRLATDAGFFAQMESFEDDLILRWHRGQLAREERASFEQAYATDARQARIRNVLRLVEVVAHQRPAPATDGRRLSNWWWSPFNVTRWAIALPLLVAAALLVTQPWRGRSESVEAELTVALTAQGERGVGPARGYDVATLEPRHSTVRLHLTVPAEAGEPPFVVEISAIDRNDTLIVTVPDLEWAAESRRLSVMVSAGRLRAGDYMLAVRRAEDPSATVVLRQAFRVNRMRS